MRAFDSLTLPTQRLLLRPLRASDAEALMAIFSDPAVMRYWSSAPWSSIEQARAFVDRDLEAMASGESLRLGLERMADHQLIGQCTLFSFSQPCRRAEIGYSLLHSAWGHGYMHEALKVLVSFGFDVLCLNRIEADIDPRNGPSASSVERLGFRKEGHLRERWIVDGEVSDSALYGLLLRDWQAAVPAATA